MAIDPNNLSGTAHLTFDEEFNSLNLVHNHTGPGTWNTTHDYSPGGYSTGNTWFVDADAAKTAGITPWTVDNGVLTITANPAPAGLGSTYTSGHLDTQGTFSQTYGYFEMSAKMPATGSNAALDGAGSQGGAAFWLLPTSGAWPPELDVFESTTWGGVFTEHSGATGTHTAETTWANIADVSTAFHRYGVDWEPDKTTWYVDGKQVFQADTPSDMNSPMYLLLDLYTSAQGGTPGTMQVDYVRAYASGAGSNASTGGTTPVTQPPVVDHTTPVSDTSSSTSGTSGSVTQPAPTGSGSTTGSTSVTPPTQTGTTTDSGQTVVSTDHQTTSSHWSSGGHHGGHGHGTSNTASTIASTADSGTSSTGSHPVDLASVISGANIPVPKPTDQGSPSNTGPHTTPVSDATDALSGAPSIEHAGHHGHYLQSAMMTHHLDWGH